jgi:hypothetical protein
LATIAMTAENFENTILEKRQRADRILGGLVPALPGLRPVFEKVSENHPDVVFAKVDTEAEQEIAAQSASARSRRWPSSARRSCCSTRRVLCAKPRWNR